LKICFFIVFIADLYKILVEEEIIFGGGIGGHGLALWRYCVEFGG
jgi:hypothetical protein